MTLGSLKLGRNAVSVDRAVGWQIPDLLTDVRSGARSIHPGYSNRKCAAMRQRPRPEEPPTRRNAPQERLSLEEHIAAARLRALMAQLAVRRLELEGLMKCVGNGRVAIVDVVVKRDGSVGTRFGRPVQ